MSIVLWCEIPISDVPQRSIIGHLFFIVYINDVGKKFGIKFLLYADDMKIYAIINSVSYCISFQSALLKIHEWNTENYLFLNVPKYSVVLFSLRTNIT